ncbi:hypothetical protein PGB28_00005 [Primorskyibacter aestuariivivens]|uniref:hypothetical protein n=1 Tax=Primorskyibacter aestuariivivens TaxID=1888912 RepID=UPI0023005C05|nr:hypothetical protein [Primorskyibacter aestuariivivens]MDA7426820.1 hypothetical protein [Primorskyibacter aestuariivivens]
MASLLSKLVVASLILSPFAPAHAANYLCKVNGAGQHGFISPEIAVEVVPVFRTGLQRI